MWFGLPGLGGVAVGQSGFGFHGGGAHLRWVELRTLAPRICWSCSHSLCSCHPGHGAPHCPAPAPGFPDASGGHPRTAGPAGPQQSAQVNQLHIPPRCTHEVHGSLPPTEGKVRQGGRGRRLGLPSLPGASQVTGPNPLQLRHRSPPGVSDPWCLGLV